MPVTVDQHSLLYERGRLMVRQYILSVLAVSLIISLVNAFISKDSAQSKLIKMISGFVLIITIISPFSNFKIGNIEDIFDDLELNPNQIISEGEIIADLTSRDIIKERSEAYILDKASDMGLTVEVEVTLNDTVPSSPYSIEITGNISPYSKMQLSKIITTDLAIPEDRQKWT